MPVIKTKSLTPTTSTIAQSSNVSSSVSGNMDLVQSQISQKSNTYINIRNAVQILDTFSNWNGYIRLYTIFENNFNVNDTVYITYTSPLTIDTSIFNLENPSNFDNPFDPPINFYLGYKVLYVNKYKNEIVINRHFNDIPAGKLLKNQYLSKISCRGGDFYDDVTDGVVFYDCNLHNSTFATISGVVSGSTIVGAKILCSGLSTTSDINGHYSLDIPAGTNSVKCSADVQGYITETFIITVEENRFYTKNIFMTPGENSITICGSTVCSGGWASFMSYQVGYDLPANYKWKINGVDVGTNNSVFSYNYFINGDIVTCEISDDITTSISNEIIISISPPAILINADPSNIIYQGDTVLFTAILTCITNQIYEWYVNDIFITSGDTYSTNTLNDGDIIICKIGVIASNSITISISQISTTTTTTTVAPLIETVFLYIPNN
jgi:hypothetical protein